MLSGAITAQLKIDAERARDDSLTLWQSLCSTSTRPDRKVSLLPEIGIFERYDLNLYVQYRVGDGNEFAGEISDVSPLGLRIKGPKSGRIGQWCVTSSPSAGIVEGVVVRAREHYFVLGVVASPKRLRKLSEQLNWQLKLKSDEVEERRASERIEMNHAKATLETPEGKSFSCEIFDLSDGGAALHLGASALYFWVDQPVRLDGREGRVLRYFPEGLVIKFD